MLTVCIGLPSRCPDLGHSQQNMLFGLWAGDGRALIFLHQSLNCVDRVRPRGGGALKTKQSGHFLALETINQKVKVQLETQKKLTFSWLWLWEDFTSGWRFGLKTLKDKEKCFAVIFKTHSKQLPQERLKNCITWSDSLCPSDFILLSNYLSNLRMRKKPKTFLFICNCS